LDIGGFSIFVQYLLKAQIKIFRPVTCNMKASAVDFRKIIREAAPPCIRFRVKNVDDRSSRLDQPDPGCLYTRI
jgi:hypothetical protein